MPGKAIREEVGSIKEAAMIAAMYARSALPQQPVGPDERARYRRGHYTFERDVLTADVIEAVVQRAVEIERAHPDDAAAQRETLRSRLRQLEGEHGRFMEAVRQWGPMGPLGAELRTLEVRRAELLAQLEHLDGLEEAAGAWAAQALAGDFAALLCEWQALLRGEPVQARQILRKLITGRLRMVPEIQPDGRFYRWTGQASYGRLLAGLIGVQGLVPPG